MTKIVNALGFRLGFNRYWSVSTIFINYKLTLNQYISVMHKLDLLHSQFPTILKKLFRLYFYIYSLEKKKKHYFLKALGLLKSKLSIRIVNFFTIRNRFFLLFSPTETVFSRTFSLLILPIYHYFLFNIYVVLSRVYFLNYHLYIELNYLQFYSKFKLLQKKTSFVLLFWNKLTLAHKRLGGIKILYRWLFIFCKTSKLIRLGFLLKNTALQFISKAQRRSKNFCMKRVFVKLLLILFRMCFSYVSNRSPLGNKDMRRALFYKLSRLKRIARPRFNLIFSQRVVLNRSSRAYSAPQFSKPYLGAVTRLALAELKSQKYRYFTKIISTQDSARFFQEMYFKEALIKRYRIHPRLFYSRKKFKNFRRVLVLYRKNFFFFVPRREKRRRFQHPFRGWGFKSQKPLALFRKRRLKAIRQQNGLKLCLYKKNLLKFLYKQYLVTYYLTKNSMSGKILKLRRFRLFRKKLRRKLMRNLYKKQGKPFPQRRIIRNKSINGYKRLRKSKNTKFFKSKLKFSQKRGYNKKFRRKNRRFQLRDGIIVKRYFGYNWKKNLNRKGYFRIKKYIFFRKRFHTLQQKRYFSLQQYKKLFYLKVLKIKQRHKFTLIKRHKNRMFFTRFFKILKSRKYFHLILFFFKRKFEFYFSNILQIKTFFYFKNYFDYLRVNKRNLLYFQKICKNKKIRPRALHNYFDSLELLHLLYFAFLLGKPKLLNDYIILLFENFSSHTKILYHLQALLQKIQIICPFLFSLRIRVTGKFNGRLRAEKKNFFLMGLKTGQRDQTLTTRLMYDFTDVCTYTGTFGVHTWFYYRE